MAPTKPVVPQYQVTVSVNQVKPARGSKNKSVVEQETLTKNIRYKNDEDRPTCEVKVIVSYDVGSDDFVEQKLADCIERGILAALAARVNVEDVLEESEDEIPEKAMPPLVKGKKGAVDNTKGTTTVKGILKKKTIKFEDEEVEEPPARRTLRSDKDKKLVPDLTFAKGRRAI